MTIATHRVVGVLEWPAGTEGSTEVLAILEREFPLHPSGSRILSMRLPLPECQDSTVLAADVPQLRRDLQRLFDDFANS